MRQKKGGASAVQEKCIELALSQRDVKPLLKRLKRHRPASTTAQDRSCRGKDGRIPVGCRSIPVVHVEPAQTRAIMSKQHRSTRPHKQSHSTRSEPEWMVCNVNAKRRALSHGTPRSRSWAHCKRLSSATLLVLRRRAPLIGEPSRETAAHAGTPTILPASSTVSARSSS